MRSDIALILAVIAPSVLGLLLMGFDKKQARQGGIRVPESVLFCMAVIGGSIGCIIGMLVFHHKTRKWKFIIGMPAIFLLQILCLFLLWRSPLQFRFL